MPWRGHHRFRHRHRARAADGQVSAGRLQQRPQVIEIGYSRLLILFGSYIFSLTYEILSGYLRGFGISLVPAILTLFGVCGVRIVWINTVFPLHHTFRSIMLVYPISLATTAALIFIALLVYRPSRRFAARTAEKPQA